jgi:hypothetical protein
MPQIKANFARREYPFLLVGTNGQPVQAFKSYKHAYFALQIALTDYEMQELWEVAA